jgi:hypothetical protein
MKLSAIRATFAIGVAAAWAAGAIAQAGPILYESSTAGPGAAASGPFLNSTQFYGVRFQVFNAVDTESIAGQFLRQQSQPSGGVFGAIVKLSGPGDFPDSLDLSTSDVLGGTVLTPPVQPALSAVVSAPLAVHLDPGYYALVYGSGLFGATGQAVAMENNSDTGSPSYFQQFSGSWGSTAQQNFYFAVTVPEPSSAALMMMFSVGLTLVVARRSFGPEMNANARK